MAQRQKSTIRRWLGSNKITAVAVVMLTVSAGTFALPQIFAATSGLNIERVVMVPSNDAKYDIDVRWAGTTTSHYNIVIYRNGVLRTNENTKSKSRLIDYVVCGATYEARVAAVGPNGGKSAYKIVRGTSACPAAAWSSFGASGNNIVSSWRPSGFAQSYKYYLKTGSGGYVASTTTATSRTISGRCGTTYSAYLVATAGNQSGPATPVRSATTAPCPLAPKPTPTPAPKPTPAPSTGGGSSSSGGSTNRPRSGGGSGGSSGSAAPAAPAAPAVPSNFAAEISAQKIVNLVWEPAANAVEYSLQRSTDNATWEEIASVDGSSYVDESTAFASTYYYQLRAIGGDGRVSEPVTAQATTTDFEATDDAIQSADKRVTVTVPEGAINGTFSCTVTIDKKLKRTAPANQRLLLGPYELACVDESGAVVQDFLEPIKVTVSVGDSAAGFENIVARSAGKSTWTAEKSTYNEDKKQLTFELTSTKSFATFGTEQRSSAWLFIVLFLVALAIGGGVFWYLRRRRRQQQAAYAPAVSTATYQEEITAEQEFQQALAQPDCSHLGMATQVVPSSQGCLECEQQHTEWKSLRICLICGHVGCSDDSNQQHALKHYQETGHPIIYDYADPNGNSIGWCYIDQTYI